MDNQEWQTIVMLVFSKLLTSAVQTIWMPKCIQNKCGWYLDSGTICGSAWGAAPSCIDDANSPLGELFLADCGVGQFVVTWRGLWWNSSPALWKYLIL